MLRGLLGPSELPKVGAAAPAGRADRAAAARVPNGHHGAEQTAVEPAPPARGACHAVEPHASKRDRRRDEADRRAGAVDPTDPMLRTLATPFDRVAAAATPAPVADPFAAAARVSLEQVMQRLVRKIAWSGDARSGTARIELGAGALEGATLLLQADGGEVRVSLEVPAGVDAAAWRERLGKRLTARGLRVASFDVT